MRSILFALALVATFSATAQAQDSDLELVAQTLNYYLQGGTNNDFATLSKAFHPTATMKFVEEEYKEVNALAFFEKGMKPGPPQDRQTRIVSVSVTGNAAHAQLEIEYSTFIFVDYMNLLKIDGEWKIVGKIFYRKMKHNGE